MTAPIIQIEHLVKAYGGLRPLRIAQFTLAAGERVGLAGFDQTMAEVFTNLVTGATLPEQGSVRLFGRPTSDIADSTDWLGTVDRFGILSERVVLLEQYSLAQNIAMSLTLEIEPIADAARGTVTQLARDVGLPADALDDRVQDTSAAIRQRVRLARAIAAGPSVLIVEHPIAGLASSEVPEFARDLARVAEGRELALVVLAAAAGLARPFVRRVLVLDGATGALRAVANGGLLTKLFKR
jgi:ABC-type transporter Mla maintaining outer membrane lipid asymmetry ATPase subunit MlaF